MQLVEFSHSYFLQCSQLSAEQDRQAKPIGYVCESLLARQPLTHSSASSHTYTVRRIIYSTYYVLYTVTVSSNHKKINQNYKLMVWNFACFEIKTNPLKFPIIYYHYYICIRISVAVKYTIVVKYKFCDDFGTMSILQQYFVVLAWSFCEWAVERLRH